MSNISERKVELLAYMKQDIFLLGCLMLKAQDWSEYKIDIVRKITLSSLSLNIFRQNSDDDCQRPI